MPIDAAKMRRHLVVDTTRLYAILDGALVPDLPMRLYESQLPHYCLLQGQLDPNLAYVAPHLVYLEPGNAFTESIFDNAGQSNCGIFIHSRSSMASMHKHFRALISVMSEDGRPLTFRYYDPRVLREFLPSCNTAELVTFFGRSDAFFARDEEGQGILKFEIEGESLKRSELN
jgi:hypothetical protein